VTDVVDRADADGAVEAIGRAAMQGL
jgi:hypothetical protein